MSLLTYHIGKGIIFSLCNQRDLPIAKLDGENLAKWVQMNGHKLFTVEQPIVTQQAYTTKKYEVKSFIANHGSEYSWFAFIASSHGTLVYNKPVILLSKTSYITQQSIRDDFSNRENGIPSFRGKPKVFVFDHCHGAIPVKPIENVNIKGPNNPLYHPTSFHPDGEQIVFRANTTRHAVSWHNEYGSYLILSFIIYWGCVHYTKLSDIADAMRNFVYTRSCHTHIIEYINLCPSYLVEVTNNKTRPKQSGSISIVSGNNVSNNKPKLPEITYSYNSANESDLASYIILVNADDMNHILNGLKYIAYLLENAPKECTVTSNEQIIAALKCILNKSRNNSNYTQTLPMIAKCFGEICDASKPIKMQLIDDGVYSEIIEKLQHSVESDEINVDFAKEALEFASNIMDFDDENVNDNISIDITLWNALSPILPIVKKLLDKTAQHLGVIDNLRSEWFTKIFYSCYMVLYDCANHIECPLIIEDMFDYGIIDTLYSYTTFNYDDNNHVISKLPCRIISDVMLSKTDWKYIAAKLLENQYLQHALSILKSAQTHIHKYIFKALQKMAKSKQFAAKIIQFDKNNLMALMINVCLNGSSKAVKNESLLAISTIIPYCDETQIHSMVEHKLFAALKAIMHRPSSSSQIKKCTQILNKVLDYGTDDGDKDDLVHQFEKAGCYMVLHNLLSHDEKTVRKDVWTLIYQYWNIEDWDILEKQYDDKQELDAISHDNDNDTVSSDEHHTKHLVFSELRNKINELELSDTNDVEMFCIAPLTTTDKQPSTTNPFSMTIDSNNNYDEESKPESPIIAPPETSQTVESQKNNIISTNSNKNNSVETSEVLPVSGTDNAISISNTNRCGMDGGLRDNDIDDTKQQSATIPELEPHPQTTRKKYQCTNCTYSTDDRGNYERHENTHRGIKLQRKQCKGCGHSMSRSAWYKYGGKCGHCRADKTKPFKCTFCNRLFKTNTQLIQHRHIHTGQKPYVCPINGCNLKYTSKESLAKHMRKYHMSEWVAIKKANKDKRNKK